MTEKYRQCCIRLPVERFERFVTFDFTITCPVGWDCRNRSAMMAAVAAAAAAAAAADCHSGCKAYADFDLARP